MKHLQPTFNEGFRVVAGTARSQAAIMVLEPQEATGGPDNQHERSDQWLYVISGQGRATVGPHQVELTTGSLLLIEAGETHEIVNTSQTQSLETLNIYAPPEY